MSEACSTAGHEILNHQSRTIRVTRKTVKALDIRGYLDRDRPTGKLRLKTELIDVLAEMEYGTPLMSELGRDFSGPAYVVCKCEQCRRVESDVDQTMTPDMQAVCNKAQVDAALKVVRAKR